MEQWVYLIFGPNFNQVYKLVEKDTQTKLETLFRKNLYQVAIDMADSNHLDKNAIVDIFVQYGDHLYEYESFLFQSLILLAKVITMGLSSNI